jgi:hypothetical protein
MRARLGPFAVPRSGEWSEILRPDKMLQVAGDGCVAQLVEQLTLNQRVHSSSLCTPTIYFSQYLSLKFE